MAMPETPVPGVDPQIHAMCEAFRADYRAVQSEIAKAIVGHNDIVDGVLTCLFVGGHALLEGVPGLAKTLLVRTLSDALQLDLPVTWTVKLQVGVVAPPCGNSRDSPTAARSGPPGSSRRWRRSPPGGPSRSP